MRKSFGDVDLQSVVGRISDRPVESRASSGKSRGKSAIVRRIEGQAEEWVSHIQSCELQLGRVDPKGYELLHKFWVGRISIYHPEQMHSPGAYVVDLDRYPAHHVLDSEVPVLAVRDPQMGV